MSASPSSFARAFCAEASLVALAALIGCARAPDAREDRKDATDRTAAAPVASSPVLSPGVDDALDAGADGGGALDPATDVLAPYLTRAPVGGKSIGHTSVVYKLRLEGGFDAAFKPRSHRGGGRYRGEIAAYRLGRALGIDNVPPAMPRRFDAAALGRALLGDALFSNEVVIEKDGTVVGAILPWIKGLTFVDLEKPEWTSRWRAWLSGSDDVPEKDRAMARAISTMIVFDYVTGNWDRWSGGNVGFDPARGQVLFIDNDGAFYETPPAAALSRQRAMLERTGRFSQSFVAALREVDLASAFGDEGGDAHQATRLLSRTVVASADARRKKALAIIDAKIARQSTASVLSFE